MVKLTPNSLKKSYCHTTSPRSGWVEHLPQVRNPSVVLNFLSHSTTRPGFLREQDRIIAKCHKNTYNYCNEADREAAGECFQGAESSLLVSIDCGFTPHLFASVLLTLAWAVEVRRNGYVILSYPGQEDRELGHGRQATSSEIFYPVLQDERKDVLAVLWVVIR